MESLKVKLNDYNVLNTLGTGTFGRVRLALQKSSNKYVALKMLKKIEIIKQKQVDHIASEFLILKTIKHPFLIEMIGYTQDERYLYFILEYIQGGELFTHLRNANTVSNDEAIFYSSQVVLMFEYLHSKQIVYRDLKPENLLIQTDGYLKLTDFGFAKVVQDKTYTLCGTPEYLAPEILLNKGHSKPVDWWCLGIFIYELLTGEAPFNDEDPMAIYQKILKGNLKFPRNFDSEAKSLVKNLLEQDVTKRFGNLKNGVNDIKNHKWYETLNWKDLIGKRIKPIFIPKILSMYDTSNFAQYPDSLELPEVIKIQEDIFKDW